MLRLLIALALALVALPGMANACHDAPPTMIGAAMTHNGMHHGAPGNPAALAPHVCVGCVPPSTWVAGVVLAPHLPILPLRIAAATPLRLAASPAPDTPPPRERG